MGTAKDRGKHPAKDSAKRPAPPDDSAEVELLSALCELTVVVAQAGQRLTPPLEIPAALKPFLKFTRVLPAQGVRVVRKILDTDAGWRHRVSAAATPALVGEAGMLFLTRPDGWDASFAEFVAKKRAEATTEGSQRTIRDLEKRLTISQDRVESLTKELVSARTDAESRIAQLRAEALANTNSLRKEKDLAETLRVELAAQKSAMQQAEQDRAKNTKRLAEAQANLALASQEIAALTERVSELAQRRTSEAKPQLDHLAALLEAAHTELRRLQGSATNPRVGIATGASGEGSALKPTRPTKSKAQRLVDQIDPAPQLHQPTVLPPGIVDGSVDSVAALVRLPKVMVIVDGYNLGKTIWPRTVDLVVLRDQLSARLEGIASRADVPITVVFDGAQETPSAVRRVRGSSVHVVFTPATKEADDFITEMVSTLRPTRPVLVVSSDQRVQRLTESLGANVVSSDVFDRAFGGRSRS